MGKWRAFLAVLGSDYWNGRVTNELSVSVFFGRLIWVTPYTFLNAVLAVIAPPAEGSARAKRGTVNVLEKVCYLFLFILIMYLRL